MKRLEKLFPPGYPKIKQDIVKEIVVIVVGLLWATIWYSNNYNLGMQEIRYNHAEKLMSFNCYSRGVCSVYIIILGSCILWAISLRGYFSRRSRSDYLMKRLPNGGEMTRRWIAAPLIMAVIGLILCVIVLLLLHLSFMKVTPAKYLPEPEAIDFINAFIPDFTY